MSQCCAMCHRFKYFGGFDGYCGYFSATPRLSDGQGCPGFRQRHSVAHFGSGCPVGGSYVARTWDDFNQVYGNNEYGYAELVMISESGETVARMVWVDGAWR